jgi:hypothetical protein
MSGMRGDVAKARAICDLCPVRVECLEWALTEPQLFWGIWAGYTPGQLSRLRTKLGVTTIRRPSLYAVSGRVT